MNPTGQSSIEALHTITLYIEREEGDEPPGQSSIETFHTITLYIYIEERDESPWSINHRGLAYHYTAYI